jgi:hypothetical protein
MKKILTFPLRHATGDCTANGLTSRVNTVDLYYGDINTEVLDKLEEDVLVLVKRQLFGRNADYAVPYSVLKSGKHSMMGGNFIYTSDSRFPDERPIPVHDRVENN